MTAAPLASRGSSERMIDAVTKGTECVKGQKHEDDWAMKEKYSVAAG